MKIKIPLFFLFFSANLISAETCLIKKSINQNEEDLKKVASWSYGELKTCFNNLGKYEKISSTNIEGTDNSAIILECSHGATQRISTFFSAEQLKNGKPIPGDKPFVFLYLTDSGFKFLEYPSYYYFVKYNDGTDAIDVGTLPAVIFPIKMDDNKERYVDGEGKILLIDQLDQYAKKAPFINQTGPKFKTKYIERYNNLLTSSQHPLVTLKSTPSLITDEQVRSCLHYRASNHLQKLRTIAYNIIASFNLDQDTKDSVIFMRTDPDKLTALKEKYKKNKDEMIADLVDKLKKETTSCSQIFTEEDYQTQATDMLKDFLVNYVSARRYVNAM